MNLEIQNQHYQQVVQENKDGEKRRDRLFIFKSILLILFLILPKEESMIFEEIVNFFKNEHNINIYFTIKYITLILWTILTWISLKYIRLNIRIDKGYCYIMQKEEEISRNSGMKIEYEGKEYLKKYSLDQKITFIFYRFGIPIITIIIVSYKSLTELFGQAYLGVIDLILAIIVIIFNILYIRHNIGEF